MNIVDRTQESKGKSLENRQRFLRRLRPLIGPHVGKAVNDQPLDSDNPFYIKVPNKGVEEPYFHIGSTGKRNHVWTGNKEFIEGDILRRPPAGGGNGKSSAGGAGNNKGGGSSDEKAEFEYVRVVLTREEFVDLYLQGLELPNMRRKNGTDIEFTKPKRGGYSKTGSPTNLAINKTMKNAMGRRIALGRPSNAKLEGISNDIEEMRENGSDLEAIKARQLELDALIAKQKRSPYIDPIDIRYRLLTQEPVPCENVVLFILADSSGSVTQYMRTLIKYAGALLVMSLKKQHKKIEIVFLKHDDKAVEVKEDEFFSKDPSKGGTKVSTVLELMKKTIHERFPPSDYNIYALHGSDGDNDFSDGNACTKLLTEDILPITNYYVLLQVGNANTSLTNSTTVWDTFGKINHPALAMARVNDLVQIPDALRKLYSRSRDLASSTALRPAVASFSAFDQYTHE